jgi:hypothetical protein
MRTSKCLSMLAVALMIAGRASAAPILGGTVIVAHDGEVIAEFLGHTAAYSNDLYLDSPANSLGIIFNNQTTPWGSTKSLGTFTAGTELLFKIYVQNTGDVFYTGPASRNPDNLEHAIVDDAYGSGKTYVGFEDLFNGGDLDYDDLMFAFTNVRGGGGGGQVPEPMTLALVGLGVGAMALGRKLRRS